MRQKGHGKGVEWKRWDVQMAWERSLMMATHGAEMRRKERTVLMRDWNEEGSVGGMLGRNRKARVVMIETICSGSEAGSSSTIVLRMIFRKDLAEIAEGVRRLVKEGFWMNRSQA